MQRFLMKALWDIEMSLSIWVESRIDKTLEISLAKK